MADRLHVDVVFADVARVVVKSVELGQGATVGDAILASGIASDIGAAIDYSRVGVFGHMASATTVVHDGDRVEIYRPLKVDPKEARRRRALK